MSKVENKKPSKKISSTAELSKLYTDDDKEYLKGILTRMEYARDMRNKPYAQFNNLSYVERHRRNVELANTILPKKKFDDDVVMNSGTVEQKFRAVLNAVLRLNLTPQARAFDSSDQLLQEESKIIDDLLFRTEIWDGDREKKILRGTELLTQGTAFVQENWVTMKRPKKKNTGTLGKFKNVKVEEGATKEVFKSRPERDVLYAPDVYLGDITKYGHHGVQPFMFYAKNMNYKNAAAIFGDWDQWEFVPRKRGSSTAGEDDPWNKKWVLHEDTREDTVEVIFYEDEILNEYNVIINGVMMLPSKYPLSAVSPGGRFTVDKQIFANVGNDFAYGKSFVETVQNPSEVLDEMTRLAILKTRRSFMPPYANIGNRHINPRILQAGRITQGIDPNALRPLGETSDGVTSSEFNMIENMQQLIDRQTVSPQFSGHQSGPQQTATQTLELKNNAEVNLGLVMLTSRLFEEKLALSRWFNIRDNFFKPVGVKLFGDEITEKFRSIARETDIPGEGTGERQIIPVASESEIPDPDELREIELEEEQERGIPVEKVIITKDHLKKTVQDIYFLVQPKEEDSNDFDKVKFTQELNDVQFLTQLGVQPNPEALQEEFARVYKKDASKYFSNQPVPSPLQDEAGVGGDPNAASQGRANPAGLPNLNNVG